MYTKKSVSLQKVASQTILIDMSCDSINCNRMITLNAMGEFIWNAMSEDTTFEQLVEKILLKFDTEREIVQRDLTSFLAELNKFGFVCND